MYLLGYLLPMLVLLMLTVTSGFLLYPRIRSMACVGGGGGGGRRRGLSMIPSFRKTIILSSCPLNILRIKLDQILHIQ